MRRVYLSQVSSWDLEYACCQMRKMREMREDAKERGKEDEMRVS